MKNESGIEVVRNAKDASGYRIIICPVCQKEIIRIKHKETFEQIGAVLGITNSFWETAAVHGTLSPTGDWEAVIQDHINQHNAAEVIARIYKLEDAEITMRATAEKLNDFIDYIALHPSWLNNPATKEKIKKHLEDAPDEFIPEQIEELIYPSSLRKTDCF